jgi:hypothetical protein
MISYLGLFITLCISIDIECLKRFTYFAILGFILTQAVHLRVEQD